MNFTDGDAQRLIRLIDERIERAQTRNLEYHVGVVNTVNTTTRVCTVFLFGSGTASDGFQFDLSMTPDVGDAVRVAIRKDNGDRWVNSILSRSVWRMMAGGISLGTTTDPSSATAIKFGADVELGRSAANVLALAAGDKLDASNLLADGFDWASAGISLSLTADVESELSGIGVSLTTPTSGNFRVWLMGHLRYSHSVAAELEAWVRLRETGAGGTTIDIPNLQTFQVGANEEASFTCLGWIDSASSGGARAVATLVNSQTVFADWSIRASATGTATVYTDATARYVSNLHAFITRLP